MNKHNLTVGQKVWVIVGGFRSNDKAVPHETKIESIGRKYFTISYDSRYKFDLGTLKCIETGRFIVCLDIEIYNQELELKKYKNIFLSTLYWSSVDNYTIEQLKQVIDILNIEVK